MKKMFRRMTTLVLAILMLIMSVPMAFATTDGDKCEGIVTRISDQRSTNESNLTTITVQQEETVNVYLQLNNYIGFTKDFVVHTWTTATDGVILYELYNPNGDYKHGEMVVANDATKWTATLPKAGTWRCKIESSVPSPVVVTLGWRQ